MRLWLINKNHGYNPGQNYLRKFSPSCPLSYATKLFPKRRLCGKKTPSPNSMLLPTKAQGSGFLLNTQHCFQGKGEREEPVQLRCLENAVQVYNFLNSFVHDCRCQFYCEHFKQTVPCTKFKYYCCYKSISQIGRAKSAPFWPIRRMQSHTEIIRNQWE